jgi:hypothetical protein
MNVLLKLSSSRRFWIALVAVVVTALTVAVPQIPAAAVGALQTFALALIAAFTVEDTAGAIASALNQSRRD